MCCLDDPDSVVSEGAASTTAWASAGGPQRPAPPASASVSPPGRGGRLALAGCSLPLTAPCPAELLEARRGLAHECLGEVLRVMRQIITKYPLLNTMETLTAAGTLIARIRGQREAGRASWRKGPLEGVWRARGNLPGTPAVALPLVDGTPGEWRGVTSGAG